MRNLLFVLALLLAAAPVSADELCDKTERKPKGKIVLQNVVSKGAKGIKACAYIAATTDQTYAALVDYESFPRWIDKVEKTEVTWTDPQVAMVKYTLGTLFGDFTYTLRRVHRKPTHVEWARVSGDFKIVDGAYTFIPIADTQASYLILETTVDPGVSMPNFIENYFREKGSRQLIDDIRQEVARRQKK